MLQCWVWPRGGPIASPWATSASSSGARRLAPGLKVGRRNQRASGPLILAVVFYGVGERRKKIALLALCKSLTA